MPRFTPVSKIPTTGYDRPFYSDTVAAFERAGGVNLPVRSGVALKAAALPLLDSVVDKKLTARDIIPTAAQFESVRNSLTNEIAVQVNATIATDYSSMLPVVEHRDGNGEWTEVKEASEEWAKFCSNDIQDHASMRLTLAHHIIGAGQSYCYVENVKGAPRVQFITPLALKGKPDQKTGMIRVWVHTSDFDNRDEEVDPRDIHSLWVANPLISLPGWSTAQSHPWTWLMPMQSKFQILRFLGRSLESMAVNRFLSNGILWFESATNIARANPLGPTATISRPQGGGQSAGGFGVGGPVVAPSPVTAPGPNPHGDKGSPFSDSGDHMRMVGAAAPVDSHEDARLYLRVLDKAYSDPHSPAARAPFPVYWPKEPKFIQPDQRFDEHRLREEQAALEAIARSSPMPFDFVLSSGSSSAHWSRSSMRREAIEVSQQHAQLFDGMLQGSLFRLWLEAAGEDPSQWRLRSDVSPIAVNPDITEAVKVGYEAGIVSDQGFLRVMGVPEEHWTAAVREDTEGKNTNPKAKAADAGATASNSYDPYADAGTVEPASSTSPDAPVGYGVDTSGVIASATARENVVYVAPSDEVLDFTRRRVDELMLQAVGPDRLRAAGLAPFPDEADGWT